MTAAAPRRGSRVEQRGPLEKGLLPACLVIFVLGFITMTLAQGETVEVSTNAPKATVTIDGRPTLREVADPSSRFIRLPRGPRLVTAEHRDFARVDQSIYVGFFGSKKYQVTMTPLMVHFRAVTEPRAQVLLNSKPIGTADDKGVLAVDVESGDYLIEAQLAGYEGEPERVAIRGKSRELYVQLRMTEARRQELASRQQRANELIQQARTLFAQRNYSAALKSAEDALKLVPQDSDARRLRDQIAETIQILK